MKTFLRIIIILLVASVVAGVSFVVVNNSTTTSSSDDGQPLAVASANGQGMSLIERPEGGELNSGLVAIGLSGVLVTLVKLTAITLVVLSLEKGLKQRNRRKWNWAQG